jgi:predicted AlkP superfamily phosphohydrolase/phosphomutase
MNDLLTEQLAADLDEDALKKGRAVVLGIDGVPYSMLRDLIARGVMPNMARLAAEGTLRRMESTLPSVSSVAWTSFRTGVNPGQHGITGFTDRRPRTYKTYFPTTKSILVSTLEEYADFTGLRVVLSGMPVNYPPVKLKRGISVGCFLSPSVEKAVCEPGVLADLQQLNYRLDANTSLAGTAPADFIADIYQVTELYREAMFKFWDQQNWDLMLIHFMSTDRLHHFMWDQYENPLAPYHQDFLKFYTRLDEIIGEVAARIPDGTLLMMLSDHGFCGVRCEVNLNAWLQQEGLLRFQTGAPKSLEEIDGRSVAFSLIPGRFYINLKGREPRGSVEPGAHYEAVRDDLIARLLALRDPDNGMPVIERVEKREDIYGEGCSNVAPDLVALAHDGYDLKDQISGREVFRPGMLKGMHTYDDAFLFVNQRMAIPEGLKIYEASYIFGAHCRCRGPRH